MLINGREKRGIKNLKIPKVLIDYSQTIDDVYENLEDYNPTKKKRVLIVFDDLIEYIELIKKISPEVTGLFLDDADELARIRKEEPIIKKYNRSNVIYNSKQQTQLL